MKPNKKKEGAYCNYTALSGLTAGQYYRRLFFIGGNDEININDTWSFNDMLCFF